MGSTCLQGAAVIYGAGQLGCKGSYCGDAAKDQCTVDRLRQLGDEGGGGGEAVVLPAGGAAGVGAAEADQGEADQV